MMFASLALRLIGLICTASKPGGAEYEAPCPDLAAASGAAAAALAAKAAAPVAASLSALCMSLDLCLEVRSEFEVSFLLCCLRFS